MERAGTAVVGPSAFEWHDFADDGDDVGRIGSARSSVRIMLIRQLHNGDPAANGCGVPDRTGHPAVGPQARGPALTAPVPLPWITLRAGTLRARRIERGQHISASSTCIPRRSTSRSASSARAVTADSAAKDGPAPPGSTRRPDQEPRPAEGCPRPRAADRPRAARPRCRARRCAAGPDPRYHGDPLGPCSICPASAARSLAPPPPPLVERPGPRPLVAWIAFDPARALSYGVARARRSASFSQRRSPRRSPARAALAARLPSESTRAAARSLRACFEQVTVPGLARATTHPAPFPDGARVFSAPPQRRPPRDGARSPDRRSARARP